MTIFVYNDIKELTGIGEEWLTDSDGNVIAMFFNGDLKRPLTKSMNNDNTLLAA